MNIAQPKNVGIFITQNIKEQQGIVNHAKIGERKMRTSKCISCGFEAYTKDCHYTCRNCGVSLD